MENSYPEKIKAIATSIFTLLLFVGIPDLVYSQYCSPQFTTGCSIGDQIQNFSTSNGITNISNLNSGCSNGNYEYISNQAVTVFPQGTFDFTVQSGSTYSQGFRIWVDWNDDGDFSDPGEDVWNSGSSATTPFNGSITVPLGAVTDTLRMRVRCDFVAVPSDPCAQQTYGEVEDYNLVVLPLHDAGIAEINSPNVPNCLSKDVYASVESISIDPLTSVRVEWSVNGANQTPYYWNGYSPSGNTFDVYLGDFPFQQGDEVKVWTVNPNGEDDKYPINDTATFVIPFFNTANMPSEVLLCPGEDETLQTGIGFASHQWSTGQTSSSISVTQGGIYEVTITDASTGCNHDYSVNVIEAPQVNLSDTTVWGCKIDGGVSLQGDIPRASYLWSTGSNATRITVQNSGTYWVQAIDPSQQCMSSDTVDVEIYELPNPAFDTERNFSTVIFKNLTQDATSYFWRFGDGGTSTEENPTHLYVTPGTYEVRLTAYNLCGQRSVIEEVGADPKSVGENTALREISLYPNPNSGLLNIELNADHLENAEVEILDLQGRLIENLNLGTVTGHYKTEVSLHNLSSGVYIVKIIGNGETISVDRIVLK